MITPRVDLSFVTQYGIGWAYGHVAYASVAFAGSVVIVLLNDMSAHTPQLVRP
jgi:hypothetical protein